MSARFGLRRFSRDGRGTSAIEFSIVLPTLIILFFGGFAAARSIAMSRKITIATRAVADLTTQLATVSSTDITSIMNASKLVLAPFDATPLGIRISEITSQGNDAKGNAQPGIVNWSCGQSAYKTNATITLPTGLGSLSNQAFIYAETFYTYNAGVGVTVVPTIQLGDNIFMVPRVSSTIGLKDSCPS